MWNVGARIALVVVAAGCGGAVASPRSTSTSVSPGTDVVPPGLASPLEPSRGFFIVTNATRDDDLTKPGTAWRFLGSEYQVVRAPDVIERQKTALRKPGPSTWEADLPSHFSVHREGDGLTLSTGQPAPATVVMRSASPDEAKAAESALSLHGTIDAACARAASCFHAASRALSPSDTREMTAGTSLRDCEATVLGYAALFASLGRSVPEACAR